MRSALISELYGMNTQLAVAVFCVESILFGFSPLKELCGDLLEQSIGENVLVLLDILCALFSEGVKLGRKQICGTAGYRLFVTDDLFSELFGDGSGAASVVSADKSLELLGYHFVALAADYVEHCLSTYYL